MSFVVRLADVGDEVVMKMDKETRYWRGGLANGTKGVVIGKNRYQRFVSRLDAGTSQFPNPGIYELDGTLQVRWEDGTEDAQSWDVELADEELRKQRYNERWSLPVFSKTGTYDSELAGKQEALLHNQVFIGELPYYECWEGDLVYGRWNNEEQFFLINAIDYHLVKDGDAVYDIRFCDKNGIDRNYGSSCLRQSQIIRIVKRGNLWKMHHNEPLTFRDLVEETSFFRSLRQCDDVRNPANGLFAWTAKEALQAIRDGIADGFTMSGNFLGLESKPYPFKMHDRELGERIRETTMKGFAGVDDPDNLVASR